MLLQEFYAPRVRASNAGRKLCVHIWRANKEGVLVMHRDRAIYKTRFGEQERISRIELWRVLCRHWFPKFIAGDAAVLDLGAGYCEFINNIACGERIAIDHNADSALHAAPGVRFIEAELREGLRQLADGSVDCVVASNVFEHLETHGILFDCLRESRRVLKPGGQLIVMQPNFSVVREHFYDFCDHILPLTASGMVEAMETTGYQIEYVRKRFLPYTTKSRYPRWTWAVWLYLKLPFFQQFMGGQFFIVGQKCDAD